MADLGIIFLRRKHHPLMPVIIYNYYRKYAVPLFLGHPVLGVIFFLNFSMALVATHIWEGIFTVVLLCKTKLSLELIIFLISCFFPVLLNTHLSFCALIEGIINCG